MTLYHDVLTCLTEISNTTFKICNTVPWFGNVAVVYPCPDKQIAILTAYILRYAGSLNKPSLEELKLSISGREHYLNPWYDKDCKVIYVVSDDRTRLGSCLDRQLVQDLRGLVSAIFLNIGENWEESFSDEACAFKKQYEEKFSKLEDLVVFRKSITVLQDQEIGVVLKVFLDRKGFQDRVVVSPKINRSATRFVYILATSEDIAKLFRMIYEEVNPTSQQPFKQILNR